jgi:cell division ATPase FtsA
LDFFKNAPVPIIYLSGGVAQIEGVSQIVESVFNLPVYIAKPSIKVNDTKYLSPRYVTIAGLIKLYFEKPKDKITKSETKENIFSKFFNKLKELIE